MMNYLFPAGADWMTLAEWVALIGAIFLAVMVLGGPKAIIARIRGWLVGARNVLHPPTPPSMPSRPPIPPVSVSLPEDWQQLIVKVAQQAATQHLATSGTSKSAIDPDRVISVLRTVSTTMRQLALLTANPVDDLVAGLFVALVELLDKNRDHCHDILGLLVKLMKRQSESEPTQKVPASSDTSASGPSQSQSEPSPAGPTTT